MIRRLLVALLPLLVIGSTARESQAFVRSETAAGSGVDLGWGTRNLTWSLSKPASGSNIAPGCPFTAAESAIKASFATWQAVSCTVLSFSYNGPTNRIDVGFDPNASDNVNLFVFRDAGVCDDPTVVPKSDDCQNSADTLACANTHNCWSHDPNIYALTTTWYNTKTGVLADSDTEFNATPNTHRFTATADGLPACTDPTNPTEANCIATDVQNTATHEIGHMLGLAHSPDPSATMFATANNGETSKRHLSPDDVDAICAVYPRWLPDTSNGGSSSGCTSAGAPALALIALAFTILRKKGSRRAL